MPRGREGQRRHALRGEVWEAPLCAERGGRGGTAGEREGAAHGGVGAAVGGARGGRGRWGGGAVRVRHPLYRGHTPIGLGLFFRIWSVHFVFLTVKYL